MTKPKPVGISIGAKQDYRAERIKQKKGCTLSKPAEVSLTQKEVQFIKDMAESYIEGLGHGLTMRGGDRIHPSELRRLYNKMEKLGGI